MADFSYTTRPIDIAIIGAGIGGASAALALRRAGFDVHVFEQEARLREVGGAIIIREPSMALFHAWGILEELRPKMVKVDEIEMRGPKGDITGATPIIFQEGEGDFAYTVHRADVHSALVSQIPADRLHLNLRLSHVDNLGDYAEAIFESGHRARARLIVGADGLRSVVRTKLDATAMTFMKIVTHRTIAPASLLPADMPNDRVRMWRSGTLSIIAIPIRNGTEIAIDAVIPAQTPPEELWSSTPDKELLSVYADFDPLIAKLIRGRTVDVTTHPVYDKEPITHWTDGRIVLLGDAAHPMAPMQGQGANQAIQDAGALATALTGVHNDDRGRALTAYQDARAPATARLQTLSRTPPKPRAGPPASASSTATAAHP